MTPLIIHALYVLYGVSPVGWITNRYNAISWDTIHDQLALPSDQSSLPWVQPYRIWSNDGEDLLCWKRSLQHQSSAPQISHKHPTPRPLSVLDMAVDAGLGSPAFLKLLVKTHRKQQWNTAEFPSWLVPEKKYSESMEVIIHPRHHNTGTERFTVLTGMTSFSCLGFLRTSLQLHCTRCHSVAPWTSVTQRYSKTPRKSI